MKLLLTSIESAIPAIRQCMIQYMHEKISLEDKRKIEQGYKVKPVVISSK